MSDRVRGPQAFDSEHTQKPLYAGLRLTWRLGFAVSIPILLLFLCAPGPNPREGDRASQPDRTAALALVSAVPDGEQIYQTYCARCHQAGGRGVPGVFPPLDGSTWVTGDKGRLIRIILHGMSGKIEVNGRSYAGVMPPWGQALSAEEVAAVATYVRTSWSNEAGTVTVDEVKSVQAATEGRQRPWTADELMMEENQGIPASGK